MDIASVKEANLEATTAEAVVLDEKETEIEKLVSRRVQEMRDYREGLRVEKIWKEADAEYQPGDLDDVNKAGVRFETDEAQGLRTRLVPVGDDIDEWRSRNSDPTLLAKIQSAIAIIIDQNPQGLLTPMGKKFEKSTAFAYAVWQNNWNISGSKEVYKKFVFNLAKYGFGLGRSYPCKIAFKKDILTEVGETPDKNVYEHAVHTWYNGVKKEVLNPFRTWLDENSKPYDEYSTNDWYFEKDFSYDEAKVEFGDYANFDKLIKPNADLKVSYNEIESGTTDKDDQKKTRKDMVTIGFYENRLKDLYVIRIPKINAILYYSPLPNDDGKLSLWHAPWMLRSIDRPDGVSLWEMIKQKKQLYDKMQNMTMDQLVLSIMKMFFYTGTSTLLADGKIKIQPGVGKQMVNGKVDWMNVPGPGKEAWEGLQYIKAGIDDDSAIPPVIEGQMTGKTLGEVLHAKEAALKKMKIPVENIAYAMEQDAYLTISWSTQILSTPEVKEFAELSDIQAYEQENGVQRSQLFGNKDEETGAPTGPFKATYLPSVSLKLEKQGDKLVESTKDRFFQIGKDIPVTSMYWRGVFRVIPKSIVNSSEELIKQNKMQLFNIIVPLLGAPPDNYAKPVSQIIKVNEEDPKDWLPDTWIQFLEQDAQSLFTPTPTPAIMPPPEGGPTPQPGPTTPVNSGGKVPTNQTSMQGAAGTTPAAGGPTVLPQAQIITPTIPGIDAAPSTAKQVTRIKF